MARNSLKEIANTLSWLFILQGISYIALGILVIIYPATLFAIVAATFIWTGLTTLMLAWRVRQSREALREVLA
jgi:uncharacterized membrane protein HdeD (DUF308 family)